MFVINLWQTNLGCSLFCFFFLFSVHLELPHSQNWGCTDVAVFEKDSLTVSGVKRECIRRCKCATALTASETYA